MQELSPCRPIPLEKKFMPEKNIGSSVGNGAREKVIAYFDQQTRSLTGRRVHTAAIEGAADNFLMFLWSEGFKIVPLTDDDFMQDSPRIHHPEPPSTTPKGENDNG